MRSDRPCRKAPDLWFAANAAEKGQAIHICLEHCSRLDECRETEEPPTYGVLAGVAYGCDALPLRAHKQPRPVRCGACIVADPNKFQLPRPAPEEGCGDMTGWRRHNKRKERPCQPCAVAYNRHRAERRKRAA